MWINPQGNLYYGECVLGDREATVEEIANWESSRNTPSIQEQIQALKPTDTCIMAAICGDETAKASIQSAYQQIEALKAQL